MWIDLCIEPTSDTTADTTTDVAGTEYANAALERAVAASFVLRSVAADPETRLIGISVVGAHAHEQVDEIRLQLRRLGADDVLLYAGVADPRAIDAADALMALGPLTNIARLVQTGAHLPPMLVAAHNFGFDPVSAAIVVAAIDDLLVLPSTIALRAAFDALRGRNIVVGKRWIAIGSTGAVIFGDGDGDGDGDGFVERDWVVSADLAAIDAPFANLEFGS